VKLHDGLDITTFEKIIPAATYSPTHLRTLATNILVVRGARMSVSTSSYFRSIYPATV
jgi:hypothetical protein